MGVICEVAINRTHDGFFRSGQILSGIIKYSLKKPTKYDSIDISFVGNGHCRWTDDETDYSNKEEYFTVQHNAYKAKCDEKLKPGDFDYPFEFIVPYDIPSSFENDICAIKYKVIVKFAKQRLFNSGDSFETEVPIHGSVSSSIQEPLLFELTTKPISIDFRSKVRVNAEIDRVLVTPGENFNLKLTVHNDSPISVIVKTELLSNFSYISSGKHEKTVTKPLEATKSVSTKIKGGKKTELVCNVPTLKSLYSIQHTKIMTGQYKVRVTLKLPFPTEKAAVEVPVVVGEKGVPLQVTIPLGLDKPSTSYQVIEKYDEHKNAQFQNDHNKLKYGSEKRYGNEESDDDMKTREKFDLDK